MIKNAGVPTDKVHFVATSASRDAKNRDEFFDGVQSRLGVQPDVISGDTEARLSFTGALSRVRPEGDPVLVMDIGGGSTEFIVGSARACCGRPSRWTSVRCGYRAVLKVSPPAQDDLARAARLCRPDAGRVGRRLRSIGTWIGVAGTATTLAGVYLELRAATTASGCTGRDSAAGRRLSCCDRLSA